MKLDQRSIAAIKEYIAAAPDKKSLTGIGGIYWKALVDEIMYAVGSLPNVRIWPRYVGYDDRAKISYGIVGEPDLEGIISPLGRMLCIEVKTGDAVLSKKQKIRRAMLEKFGALYIEARSVEQVLEIILANLP